MIMEIVNTVVILCLMYICGKYISHLWNIRYFPPGPFPLPVIGNIHSILNQKLHLWAADMAKKYGTVFSVSFGMERFIFINAINPTLDTLVKKSKNFSGRPTNNYFIEILSRGFNNITFSDYSEIWKIRRKLGHTALAMLNDESGNAESKIIKESEELHLRIRKNVGKTVNMKKELGCSIINIMLNMLFDVRYDPDDKELASVITMNDQIMSSLVPTDLNARLKWVSYIYPTKNYLQLKDAIARRDTFISKHLKEHLQTYKQGVKRDFTDYIIQNRNQNKDVSISNSDLEMILADMIFGGTETSLTALRWMIVYLLHWPEYQDELFNDILKNTNSGRYPGLKDKNKLHFVQAFIHEALRFSSFFPINAPHKTIVDENVCTYNVPKGTTVFYNIWAIHHQEDIFENSWKFNPHRWVDNNGTFHKSKSFMLFSAGTRACLGENLARAEIFLFLTRLVRDFKILAEPNVPLPDLEGVVGGTILPKEFNVKFESR